MLDLKTLIHNLKQRENLAAWLAIFMLGALIYGHTLQAPWYLDDIQGVVENRSVQQLSTAAAGLLADRGPATLTFALNYHLGGAEVTGYHLVNIAIHLLAAALVFLILKRVIPGRSRLALAGALVFVAHPLQTQAVTYLVQRTTSLAALFFFLALYLYILARETATEPDRRQWFFYGGALLCGALAVLTKPNTAVLPLALILFHRYFLPTDEIRAWPRLLLYVAPFALVPAWSGLTAVLLPVLSGAGMTHVEALPDLIHLRHNSPLNYLATQFSVIWIYLRLLFFPLGQALEYDLPIVQTIFAWRNAPGLLGIILLLAGAFWLRQRQPLISAGILWFFLGLAVESSIIPLDPVFEHRLYLPMFGFALVVMAGLQRLPTRTALVAATLLVAVLAVLTWQRNALWADPLAFYQDNVRRAPQSERANLDLANLYRIQGRLDEAERYYRRTLAINPDYVLVHINLALLYNARRDYPAAEAILLEGIRRNPYHFRLYNNLGVIYNFLGRFAEAAFYLEKGAALESDNATLHFNLGVAYERLGRLNAAIDHYRRAIMLDPADPQPHFTLGGALHQQGAVQEALQAFMAAARLDPNHAHALYNAALIHLDLGNVPASREIAARLQRVDPALASTLPPRLTGKGG